MKMSVEIRDRMLKRFFPLFENCIEETICAPLRILELTEEESFDIAEKLFLFMLKNIGHEIRILEFEYLRVGEDTMIQNKK
jgi:hypothetical protein